MLTRNILSPNGNRSCDGTDTQLVFPRRCSCCCSSGLKLHVTDIYLEELAKVGGVALKPKRLLLLLSPFFNIIKSSDQ